jgi:hypothetical protein
MVKKELDMKPLLTVTLYQTRNLKPLLTVTYISGARSRGAQGGAGQAM